MNIKRVIALNKLNFVFVLLLVVLEAGLSVLFPLFIGYAIDDALVQTYGGAILLGGLGLVTLLIGAGRRFYDSRFYANIFRDLGAQVGDNAQETTSAKSAHLRFLGEVVEFFENSMPEIVNSLIGLVGTLVIIITLDMPVFFGCLAMLAVVIIVYSITRKKTVRFNACYNDEQEQRVAVLSKQNRPLLRQHLSHLMKWNIKLSDLETINFSVVWLFMMAFLVLAVVGAASQGMMTYGAIFSLILYVFQFIENASAMPFFINSTIVPYSDNTL